MVASDDDLAGVREAIFERLSEHYSCTHPELESRLAERYHIGDNRNIDPHRFTTALGQMLRGGTVASQERATRGRPEPIKTFHLTGTRTTTKINQAAARKRLLSSRWRGWAQGTARYPHGLVGPAGEVAVRGGIRETMQPISPNFGEVSTLLGQKLEGSIDTGGYLVILDAAGLPLAPLAVPIEVKNVHNWIYPGAGELYQLLSKCVHAQRHIGERSALLPTLVCRRAHPTLFFMASALGFVVIDAQRQWVGDVDEALLLEVRNELHLQDLHVGSDPSIRVHDRFATSGLRGKAHTMAATWVDTANDDATAGLIHDLRRTKKNGERQRLLAALRDRSEERGLRGGW